MHIHSCVHVQMNKEDERDVPLLREDQERINEFARYTHRVNELREEIAEKEVRQIQACRA